MKRILQLFFLTGVMLMAGIKSKLYAFTICNPSSTATPFAQANLLSFNAQFCGNSVNIIWSASGENDCKLYTVERSADGKHFQIVSIIPAMDSRKEVMNYLAFDDSPLKNGGYYRLKLKDTKGKDCYSDTIYLGLKYHQLETKIYPETGDGKDLNARFASSVKLSISVLDDSKKVVLSKKIKVKGDFSLEKILRSSNLSRGNYSIVLSDDKTYAYQKLKIE